MLQVDCLYEAVASAAPCVGLDTDLLFAGGLCTAGAHGGENVFAFNCEIIEATKAAAACFKGADCPL